MSNLQRTRNFDLSKKKKTNKSKKTKEARVKKTSILRMNSQKNIGAITFQKS